MRQAPIYIETPYTDSVSKTISIADDVYLLLSRLKRADESFNDVLRRLMPKRPWTDWVGALPKESADAIAKAVEQNRKDRMARRRKELGL